MKTRPAIIRIVIVTLGLVVLAFLITVGSWAFAFFTSGQNMKVGARLMVNLNDESLAFWIDDARFLHSIDSLRAMGDRGEKQFS